MFDPISKAQWPTQIDIKLTVADKNHQQMKVWISSVDRVLDQLNWPGVREA